MPSILFHNFISWKSFILGLLILIDALMNHVLKNRVFPGGPKGVAPKNFSGGFVPGPPYSSRFALALAAVTFWAGSAPATSYMSNSHGSIRAVYPSLNLCAASALVEAHRNWPIATLWNASTAINGVIL